MIILNYSKSQHKEIIHACVLALKSGKVVAYPTDTSYGLAVDASNFKAVKKLYNVKERGFKKAVHVVVPSKAYGKRLVGWNKEAEKLSVKFWPGPLTLVLRSKNKEFRNEILNILTAKSGFLGLRMPNNRIALGLAKALGRPITATSANPSALLSGGYDSYSAEDVYKQFRVKKFQPDIIINAGKLLKRKPSTLVKLEKNNFEILRKGPVSEKEIKKILFK
ncbi:MAG: threonylcarbamoyl-AMP synthase [Candidatus Doudnabacteria bacterium]|nr:threonylcarbamoyl-AMP synthase [Candidatus Doudnabacteria bacterium]